MKSKRQKFILKTTLVLALALAAVAANTAPAQVPGGVAPPAIDSTTGLPIAAPEPPWKDPDWKDPEKTLAEVVYNNLPLDEVARDLREQFKQEFDVLLPNGGPWETNWREIPIQLRLKNVSASEVFNAMNLTFETERTPLRWNLIMNGKRPTALLRVTAELPLRFAEPPPPQRRMVLFVGDLIGDAKNGGMAMEQIIETVSEVYKMAYGDAPSGGVQFHKGAQLLIVTGTIDQIEFIQQTLMALKQKTALRHAQSQTKTDEPKSKPPEAKKP